MRVSKREMTVEQQVLPGADIVPRLVEAMETDMTASFVYDSKPRTVEVHAVGTSTKDGGLVMRGVQVAGGASRTLPQWSLFRLDQINGIYVDPLKSQAPRQGYRMGDSQMDVILAELAV